jgi:hypothetical protein
MEQQLAEEHIFLSDMNMYWVKSLSRVIILQNHDVLFSLSVYGIPSNVKLLVVLIIFSI